jgi:hypothetical protein
MTIAKNKKATLIALFLISTIAATIVALPVANAHYPAWNYPSWCYVAVTDSVIGVNQQELIIFWLDAVPPTAAGATGDRWKFYVDIVKPDGSNETLGPFTSDAVGGSWASYTPTQVGTYTIVARFPGQTITGYPTPSGAPSTSAYVNDTYAASTSDPVTIFVQQEPLQPWPEAPLPTQFWTRPINSANRNWYVLAGNWLAGAGQNVGPTTVFGYGLGPESAHVMWATPLWAGGIMDARFGDVAYTSTHYEGLTFTPIILDGKIYYNVASLPRYGWYCLNLYTGETEYFHNTTGPVTGVGGGFAGSGSISRESLAFGQVLLIENPNQKGGFPYLWSTTAATSNTWMMFDGFTGNYICSIANVSASGTAFLDNIGSICRVNIVNLGTTANPKYYMQIWNTTEAIWWKPAYGASPPKTLYNGAQAPMTATGNDYWMWRPGLNMTYDGNNGFSMNVSITDIRGPRNPIVNQTGSIRAVRADQFIIVGTAGSNNEQGVVQGFLRAYSLEPNKWGQVLWEVTFTPPSSAGNKTISMGTVDPEDGVFLFSCPQTRQRWGYSLKTGQLLWGPTEPEPQLNFYSIYTLTNIYQGKLLTFGCGGVLIAYNITTGKQVWNYTAGFDFLSESPYGNSPLVLSCIADGKIYLGATFWGTNPPWRDYIRCVNASNGAELWKILFCDRTSGVAGQLYIADGFIVSINYFDNQIYCFGKGPSATTVTAPQTVITRGQSAMITGTVTDQSPGAKKLAQTLGYTNGVPAMSDEDQQAWMEYLYERQAMPTNAKGVAVSLDTVDPNGNYVHIATVTSDITGAYGYKWTPEVPGTYQIIATFAGSAAYGASFSQTYVGVDEAPPATAPPEYPQPIDNTMTIIGVGIAMTVVLLIAIILVGIWIRRK